MQEESSGRIKESNFSHFLRYVSEISSVVEEEERLVRILLWNCFQMRKTVDYFRQDRGNIILVFKPRFCTTNIDKQLLSHQWSPSLQCRIPSSLHRWGRPYRTRRSTHAHSCSWPSIIKYSWQDLIFGISNVNENKHGLKNNNNRLCSLEFPTPTNPSTSDFVIASREYFHVKYSQKKMNRRKTMYEVSFHCSLILDLRLDLHQRGLVPGRDQERGRFGSTSSALKDDLTTDTAGCSWRLPVC